LKANPIWISAFANGEGCFTASLMCYLKGMWGLQPQCEFNITQKVEKLPLGRRTYAAPRVPFFLKYPLLSAKSYEFEKWCNIVKLLRTQNHIGKTLTARDAFLDIAKLCSDLNSKRNNPSKVIRAEIVKEWLESLTGVPSIEAKAELQARIQKAIKL
jgi:hypothetical protein